MTNIIIIINSMIIIIVVIIIRPIMIIIVITQLCFSVWCRPGVALVGVNWVWDLDQIVFRGGW